VISTVQSVSASFELPPKAPASGASTAKACRASMTAPPPASTRRRLRREPGVTSASARKIASGVYAMMRVSSGIARSPAVSITAQSPPSAAPTTPGAGTPKRGAGGPKPAIATSAFE
jgi:hypothetical protein